MFGVETNEEADEAKSMTSDKRESKDEGRDREGDGGDMSPEEI